MSQLASLAKEIFATPFVLVFAALIALGANELFFRFLSRVGRRWADRSIALAIARRCWWPGRILLPATAALLALPLTHLSTSQYQVIQHVLSLVMIGAAAWTIVALSAAFEDAATARFRIDVQDNLRARRVRTRVSVFRRITLVIVTTLAIAAMLTTFEGARSLGTTLLFSLGIAGIVVGVAARPTVSNLIAGAQIFFADPIRIDDVVVVEGQWGRVHEITLTYVVVRTWDERSIVLPVTYFLDHPYENWTRSSAHLLAAVRVAADFTVPVDRVREELGKIVQASDLWDRRFWNLQVTDLTDGFVELRALMSAADATSAWDLRCEVREKLLAFLQRSLPETLPRRRVEVADRESRHTRNGVREGMPVG
jgi:small-conductance mechanosensitive channel